MLNVLLVSSVFHCVILQAQLEIELIFTTKESEFASTKRYQIEVNNYTVKNQQLSLNEENVRIISLTKRFLFHELILLA